MTTFWESAKWRRYEHAYGDEPGTRAKLLAEADFNTRIVDLSVSEKGLWRGVRKSYRPLINKLGRKYRRDPDVADGYGWMMLPRGINTDWIWIAQRIHHKEAGRETRPADTWKIMGEWMRDIPTGGALNLAFDYTDGTGRRERQARAFAYFAIHGEYAYYFSAASIEPNLGIALIWWSMLALKDRGVRWCELGWQGAATNEKERNIEFTRRGFGGKDVPASWSGRALTEGEWKCLE